MSSIEIKGINEEIFPVTQIGNEYYFGVGTNVNDPLNAILHIRFNFIRKISTAVYYLQQRKIVCIKRFITYVDMFILQKILLDLSQLSNGDKILSDIMSYLQDICIPENHRFDLSIDIHQSKLYVLENLLHNVQINQFLKKHDRIERSKLYKYITLNLLHVLPKIKIIDLITSKLSDIKNGKLYYARENQLNDIFDLQVSYDSNYLSNNMRPSDISEQMVIVSLVALQGMVLSASLSTVAPNTMSAANMWGLYGGQGDGICLEYDINEIIEMYLKEQYQIAQPLWGYDMIYIEEKEMIKRRNELFFKNYIPEMNSYQNLCITSPKQQLDQIASESDFLIPVITRFASYKTYSWQHEYEVRLSMFNPWYREIHGLIPMLKVEINHLSADALKQAIVLYNKISMKYNNEQSFDFSRPSKVYLGYKLYENQLEMKQNIDKYYSEIWAELLKIYPGKIEYLTREVYNDSYLLRTVSINDIK